MDLLQHSEQVPTSVNSQAPRRNFVTKVLDTRPLNGLTADSVDIFREVMDKHYNKATKNEQVERQETTSETYKLI